MMCVSHLEIFQAVSVFLIIVLQMDLSVGPLDKSAIGKDIWHKKDHICCRCNYQTTDRSNFRRHIQTHVSSDDSGQTSKKQRHLCDQCGKNFGTKFGLKLHEKNKHSLIFKHTCKTCGKGFNQNVQYRFHCRNHHRDTGMAIVSETCPYCKTVFYSPGSLKRHSQYCSRKPECDKQDSFYICNVCSKSFVNKYGLDDHMRGKHEPPRFKCEECGRLFSWRSSLKAHQRKCRWYTCN